MAKILIVDDRTDNRQFLLKLLGYFDHELLEASDGEEGLTQVRQHNPDLVITDVMMPMMDGCEFVRKPRSAAATARIPVILYAAFPSQVAEEYAKPAYDVAAVITKPAHPEDILKAVNTVLGLKQPVATGRSTGLGVGAAGSCLLTGNLLEMMPAGAFTCDADGLITYFNRRAAVLWGLAPRLNNPADRFCGSFKLFAVDGSPVAHDGCWMARALKEEHDSNGREIFVERPDGTCRHCLAHANPLHDEAGKLVGSINVLVDITEQKEVEQALRQSECEARRHLRLLDAMQDAVLVFDPDTLAITHGPRLGRSGCQSGRHVLFHSRWRIDPSNC